MMRALLVVAVLTSSLAADAAAQDGAMTRVLSCVGPDARMEVYLPQSIVSGRGIDNLKIRGAVIGRYSLDLSDIDKGKTDEQVRISLSADKRTVIVDQFTRKLPPTRIPVAGGTVNFDNRFGTKAKCGPFNG